MFNFIIALIRLDCTIVLCTIVHNRSDYVVILLRTGTKLSFIKEIRKYGIVIVATIVT